MLFVTPNKDSAVSAMRPCMTTSIDAILIMGVSGCGKSSVGEALCLRNGAYAIEGDSFHPAANIEKMSAGIPLTDEDRAGWLDTLASELQKAIAAGQRPVLTCSALKLIYRDRLRQAVRGIKAMFRADGLLPAKAE